jgi:hypothetical protein
MNHMPVPLAPVSVSVGSWDRSRRAARKDLQTEEGRPKGARKVQKGWGLERTSFHDLSPHEVAGEFRLAGSRA